MADVLISTDPTCLSIARTNRPPGTGAAYGVLAIGDDAGGRPLIVRYLVAAPEGKQAPADEPLVVHLPLWMRAHFPMGPIERQAVTLIDASAIAPIACITVSLASTSPWPLPLATFRRQLDGLVVRHGSLALIYAYGCSVTVRISLPPAHQEEGGLSTGIIHDATLVSIDRLLPAPLLGAFKRSSESMEKGEQRAERGMKIGEEEAIGREASAIVSQVVERLSLAARMRGLIAPAIMDRVLIVPGCTIQKEAHILARLSSAAIPSTEGHVRLAIAPLGLLDGDGEVDRSVGEMATRRELLAGWLSDANGSDEEAPAANTIVLLRGAQVITCQASMGALCKILAAAPPTISFLLLLSQDEVPQSWQRALGRHQLCYCTVNSTSSGPSWHGRLAAFEHRFNTAVRNLSTEESWQQIVAARSRAGLATIGSVLCKGVTTWEDIKGYEQTIERLRDLLNGMTVSRTACDRLGIHAPKGILIHGEAGCGKSAIVRAIASESPLPVIQVGPCDILSKYLGESESNLRRIFKRARQSAPCILFIDSINLIGSRRGDKASQADSTGVGGRLLSTLLNEMDGITTSQGVLVLGVARHIADLDDALIRPGRLEHHVEIGLPSHSDRRSICSHLIKRFTFALPAATGPDGDSLEALAEATEGMRVGAIIGAFAQAAREGLASQLAAAAHADASQPGQAPLVLPLGLVIDRLQQG